MAPLSVLMVGTGEYTTGFVGGGMSGSDKKVGVVGLTLFDLRRRGKVGKLSMVGTSGFKFPAIQLLAESRKHDVFVFIEHHKRFDPAYLDAKASAKGLGNFNYFYSYMSQPKSQLETFKAWTGNDSDISYYLNSHHVDICEWMVSDYRPVRVMASGSRGTSEYLGCAPGTEDTISLLVGWEKKREPERVATGVYTASWTAPQRSGVHSNQSFHYLASKGEIRVDQAKRGYDVADDSQGQIMWYNPFYMKYSPDDEGNFKGQTGYGYISFEKFVDSVTAFKEGKVLNGLITLKNAVATTAILEAGRRSLDESRTVQILEENGQCSLK